MAQKFTRSSLSPSLVYRRPIPEHISRSLKKKKTQTLSRKSHTCPNNEQISHAVRCTTNHGPISSHNIRLWLSNEVHRGVYARLDNHQDQWTRFYTGSTSWSRTKPTCRRQGRSCGVYSRAVARSRLRLDERDACNEYLTTNSQERTERHSRHSAAFEQVQRDRDQKVRALKHKTHDITREHENRLRFMRDKNKELARALNKLITQSITAMAHKYPLRTRISTVEPRKRHQLAVKMKTDSTEASTRKAASCELSSD